MRGFLFGFGERKQEYHLIRTILEIVAAVATVAYRWVTLYGLSIASVSFLSLGLPWILS